MSGRAAGLRERSRLDDGQSLLEVAGLTKQFGATRALVDGNLSVRGGEIHGLLGENGAGKSTLIRCLARLESPDSGSISVAGVPLSDCGAGAIAFIHQEAGLVDELSVAENIALSNGFARRWGLIDWREVERAAQMALSEMRVDLDPRQLVGELPQATRTAVAIARAVVEDAQVFVLDEPTANLSSSEVAALAEILRRLRQSGHAIVFVTHRLDEVYDLCDRVTVLRDGATVGSIRPADTSHADLVRLITGSDVVMPVRPRPVLQGSPVVEGRELRGEFVGPVSFEVRAGEIVGLTGLTDAGHYQLGAILFGVEQVTAGTLTLAGTDVRPRNPSEAVALGVGYVPPDRARDGVVREMTLSENLFLNPDVSDGTYLRGGFLSARKERATARSVLSSFSVRPPDPALPLGSLSGGNAQKVLVARWLHDPPKVIVLTDLTQGVDIGARSEIYALVLSAAEKGTAVVVVTSDFQEIEAICSRTYVLSRGRVVGELDGSDVSVEAITSVALSGQLARPA